MLNKNIKETVNKSDNILFEDNNDDYFNGNGKINRKQFFKGIGLLLLVPFFGLWYSAAERQIFKESGKKKLVIPADTPQGITFIDPVIVDKRGNDVKIFSSRCTHLGCKINKVEGNELVCPCHGSRYTYGGKVIKGPAAKNLLQYSYTINKKTGELIVNVPA